MSDQTTNHVLRDGSQGHPLSHDEWLAARRTGIGGSDMAAIMGMSKFRTPLGIYNEKADEPDWLVEEDTDLTRWGKLLEPVIRQRYSDVTGQDIHAVGFIRDPVHWWRFATVDGVTDSRVLVECKNTRYGGDWGDPGTADVPPYVFIQVQHGLAVTGLQWADIPVLISGSDFRIYCVEADAECQEQITMTGAEFWQRVQDRNPPDPISVADAQHRWRDTGPGQVTASSELEKAVQELRQIKSNDALSAKRKDAYQTSVMNALGERDTLIGLDETVLVTWKKTKNETRQFLLKEKKL